MKEAIKLLQDGLHELEGCDAVELLLIQKLIAVADTLAQPEKDMECWKLVPIEPTGVMKDCGASALPLGSGTWNAADVYRAMLAAAPHNKE